MSFIIPGNSGGAPGGVNTQIQYNNAGSFAGTADMVYDAANNAFSPNKIIGSPVAGTFTVSALDTSTGGAASNLTARAGDTSAAGSGGQLNLKGGTTTVSGAAGNVSLQGGDSVVAGVAGGDTLIKGGIDGTGASPSSIRLRNSDNTDVVRITSISGASALGFFSVTPIVQPTNSGAIRTMTAGVGVPVTEDATWSGYTIGRLIRLLQQYGFIA